MLCIEAVEGVSKAALDQVSACRPVFPYPFVATEVSASRLIRAVEDFEARRTVLYRPRPSKAPHINGLKNPG